MIARDMPAVGEYARDKDVAMVSELSSSSDERRYMALDCGMCRRVMDQGQRAVQSECVEDISEGTKVKRESLEVSFRIRQERLALYLRLPQQ